MFNENSAIADQSHRDLKDFESKYQTIRFALATAGAVPEKMGDVLKPHTHAQNCWGNPRVKREGTPAGRRQGELPCLNWVFTPWINSFCN